MTNAIEWIRTRLSAPRPSITSPLEVEGETFDVFVEFFKGILPRRMIRELAREDMVQTDDVHESLYVSEKGNYVEFSRTTYTKRAIRIKLIAYVDDQRLYADLQGNEVVANFAAGPRGLKSALDARRDWAKALKEANGNLANCGAYLEINGIKIDHNEVEYQIESDMDPAGYKPSSQTEAYKRALGMLTQ